MGPGIERWPCAHKDPDMRVHGTTPRARSAVHTSLIHAGVKPLYAEPGRNAGHNSARIVYTEIGREI